MQVSAKQLLEAGAHFGHRKNKWNPKMGKYIYTSRNNIHIINIEQTMKMLEDALSFVQKIAADGGNILFVGTKRQAQDAVAEEAERCGMPFISSRWRGGLFTNFKQVSKSIELYKELEQNIDTFKANKKLYAKKTRELAKFTKDLRGLKNFYELPQAMFVIDPLQEQMAVKEAKLLNVPIVALLDTDCDPDVADYPIPANDDALRSVRLITKAVADTVCEARGIPTEAKEEPVLAAAMKAAEETGREENSAATPEG